MDLEANDLRTYLTVVGEGSFGRAASALLVSQPTVSERIARLERTLGRKLFARGARGVTLTGAGERFLPYATRLSSVLEEAAHAVRSSDPDRPLRLGVHATFGYRVLPLVMRALSGTGRNVRVRDAHSDQIVSMLLDGVLDLGFVLPGARPTGLRFTGLDPDPVVCVAAPEHKAASARRLSLTALSRYPVALNFWGIGIESVLEHVGGAGAGRGLRVECSEATSALALAREDGYVAFVALSAAIADLTRGSLKRVNVTPQLSWAIRLVMASRTAQPRDPHVERVLRALEGRASKKSRPSNRPRKPA